ncbi:MAG TPA: hypothetical protein VJT75_11845 [Thermoleophilaceae bacterium]|nr:hypothetical protein [Thermoleophilaceae bacterium]
MSGAAGRPVRARAAQGERTSVGVRFAAIGCLVGIAVTHQLDLQDKLDEAPYLAAMFIALIVASYGLALVFAAARVIPDGVWRICALVAVGPLVGYVVSRSPIGLPQIEDHRGHWADPYGTASVVCEALLLGLSLGAVRARTLLLAPSGVFLAAGLVAGGLMLGESHNHHVGHAGHSHAGAAGAGHSHAAGGHARHVGMNIYTATPGQQAQGRELLERTRAVAASRFASFDRAKAAGYGFTVKSFDDQKDLDYWHLTNPTYLEDGRDLDPDRPESLMYWHRSSGAPVLVAVVYRVASSRPNPALGGPILQWHLHKNAEGGFGRYKMTHLWLVPGMVDAYSMEMPVAALSKRYGTPADGTGTGL